MGLFNKKEKQKRKRSLPKLLYHKKSAGVYLGTSRDAWESGVSRLIKN